MTDVESRQKPEASLKSRASPVVKWLAERPFEIVRTLLVIGLAALVVVHGFWSARFVVDTTSLGLIALLLVVLVLPEIEEFEAFGVKFKRKIRDVEARAAAEAESAPAPTAEVQPLLLELRRVTAPAADAVGVALGARTTVVAALRRLHRLVALVPSTPTDVEILLELAERGYVTPSQADVVRDVIALSNRAAHGRGVSDEDAARLDAAARSVAEAITAQAPFAFERDVGRLLETSGLPVEGHGLARDAGVDFVVRTRSAPVLVEVKFWTRTRPDAALRLLFREERQRGHEGMLCVVVPNLDIDVARLDVPPRTRIMTIARLADLVARGADLFDESPSEPFSP